MRVCSSNPSVSHVEGRDPSGWNYSSVLSSVVESGCVGHGCVRLSGLLGIGIGGVPPWNVRFVWSSYPPSDEVVGAIRVLGASAQLAEGGGVRGRGGNHVTRDDPVV